MASSVSGSYQEAFAAARHEVGPGGVFNWNGELYSTYSGDEWNRLTPAQQAEFSARVQELEAELGDEVELVDDAPDADPADTDDVVILNETDFSGGDPSFMGGGLEEAPSE